MRMAAIVLWLFCTGCFPMQGSGSGKSPVPGEGGESEQEELLARYLHRKRLSADSTNALLPHIALVSFVDKSGFRKDVWKLGTEMRRLFSTEMTSFPDWLVVPDEVVVEVVEGKEKMKPEEALAYGRIMEADIVLLGTVVDYNMGRFSVGDPLLGGYKSYTGIAQVELRALRVKDGSEIGTVEGKRELVDRDLGLDLLGKPREQDLQFTGLQKIPFGSKAFKETVLGVATMEVVGEVLDKLAVLIRPRALNLRGRPAEVLSVYGGDVYVNIGSENGLHAGYRFEVLPGPQRVRAEGLDPHQRVGILEIAEVIGARLSSVRILEGAEQIQAGDRLQLMQPDEGEE